MRALLIGPEEKQAIAKVVAYAMEHFYEPSKDAAVPGANPNFAVHVPDGFRCVFTFTRHEGKLFRHLSISVLGEKYPSPEAAVMLAKEFGFTASDDSLHIIERMKDGWMVSMGHPGEHCIVLIQPVQPVEAKS